MTENTTNSLSIRPGSSDCLGATPVDFGVVNFAVFSSNGESVDLCLFCDPEAPGEETCRIRLTERTGDIWHNEIAGIPEGTRYGFRVHGLWAPNEGHLFNPRKLLLDPYAKRIDGPSLYDDSLLSLLQDGSVDQTDSAAAAPKAVVPLPDTFDWEGDTPLRLPMAETVVMEMHLKGFTRMHPDIPEDQRGTYAGLCHDVTIDYLQGLGITAVQLLPVHQHLDDGFLLDRGLVNYWGYNTLGFFAPEARFAVGDDPVTEFREMVKRLHRAGIEVILDVVYNHTCEAGVTGPTCFLRGFDNHAYYHSVDGKPGIYHDVTGCGNSVNIPHPFAMRMVMDSLRYWVEEMHVDGFRFDLAVEMGREPKEFSRRCAFFKAAQQDPVLRRTKLIAEPWDLGLDGYQLGNFPANWKELNGKFRDCVRAFWRGDPGVAGEFAARLTGSQELFAHNNRKPSAGLNMITSHDGFTLRDLVSYNDKHNEQNGEENRDGDSHNISYNLGAEGETTDSKIQEVRLRQIRNFLVTSILSQGTPFITAGDEALRTQGGNNNSYCQDNEISWLNWSKGEDEEQLRRFVAKLLAFRKEHPALHRQRFFSGKKIGSSNLPDASWMRPDGGAKEIIDWSIDKAGAFAMMIHRDLAASSGPNSGFLLFFFNARARQNTFHFPKKTTCSWERIIDTADPDAEVIQAGADEVTKLSGRSFQLWREKV